MIWNLWVSSGYEEKLKKKKFLEYTELHNLLAVMAQRAECVMLNKGVYIEKTVKMLDKILRRMQRFQKKKETILPKLNNADKLYLSHESFDV